jgi:hypothetical protein
MGVAALLSLSLRGSLRSFGFSIGDADDASDLGGVSDGRGAG